MKFANPEMFWLLVVIPFMVYFQFWREAKRLSDFRFPTIGNLKGLSSSLRVRFRYLPFMLRVVSLVLLIIVLARPQKFDSQTNKKVEGIDIVLCLDTSTSMLAEDLKPNRIEAAKTVAADFVKKRESDRIALVPFAAEGFTQCPLTTDYTVLTSLLSEIKTGMVEDGTAIGLALATSVNRLRESKAKSKVVILLTDGQNNRGEIDPVTAAQAASALGIKVYTIGAGTRGTAPYPIQTPFGKRYQNVPVDVDDKMLQEIAELTGGKYYRATNEKTLKEIYTDIDKLEKSKVDVQEYKHVAEVFGPWLLFALVTITLEMILSLTGLRKLP